MSIPKLEFPPFHLPPEAEALARRSPRVPQGDAAQVSRPRIASRAGTRVPGVQQGVGQARLDRHHLAQAVWRRERSFLDRYVVTEELLGNGAPAGAHWVADRQSGPLLLRFGSEQQRQAILPRITRGRVLLLASA